MKKTLALMALIGAVVLGGVTALLLEWSVFRKKPTTVPLVLPAASQSAASSVNRCSDLYGFICALPNIKDPTGDVKRDSEGEVEVLRMYETIVRKNKKISRNKVDEILVSQIYTPERVTMIRELFDDVKESLIEFIEAQPFQALSAEEKSLLKGHIEKVRLELPPPAKVYADERELFTKNDVFFERSSSGETKIRIGGAIFYTVRSNFNLAFTLAHELAHAIDPCELKHHNIDILSYHGLSECFGSSMAEFAGECKPEGMLSEIFSDWMATHVVAKLLVESSKTFTKSQLRNAVYNSVRDLCRVDDGQDDQAMANGLSASHPNEAYRVNRIFAQHPQIRKFIACKDPEGPSLPGVPLYCFWSVQKK